MEDRSGVGFIFVMLFGFVIILGIINFIGGPSIEYDNKNKSYIESQPNNMSESEWNYIGNTASEHGYSEEEAKQIGEALSIFKDN